MKILINTSVSVMGGALQVASSVIREFAKYPEHEVSVILSPQVATQFDAEIPGNITFFPVKKSPAPLLSRMVTVKRLNQIEKQVAPDVVFTVFGPSYWTPRAPHLLGFANGAMINPDSRFVRSQPLLRQLVLFLGNRYRMHYVKKNAGNYVVETADAARRLSLYGKIDPDVISLVGNTCHDVFNDFVNTNAQAKLVGDTTFRLLTVSADLPSKNLSLIQRVLDALPDEDLCFIVTLPPKSFNAQIRKGERRVENVGPVPIHHCPDLYRRCDAVFLPSLLETFSANYPEAMVSMRPIIASDMPFSRALCGEAAEYFDPFDVTDAARAVLKVKGDIARRKQLIVAGKNQLLKFPSPAQRAQQYLEILGRMWARFSPG